MTVGTGRRREWGGREGFTLIELGVVMFLIVLIAAVAFPQLLPVIAFSRLEGQSKHLANYGQAAMAHAMMMHQELTIYVDLDEQEYYTVRWVYPDEEGESEGEGLDQLGIISDMRQTDYSSRETAQLMAESRAGQGDFFEEFEGFDDELANQRLNDVFDQFARRITEQRARNVIHEEGFLDEIGGLFEDEFSLEEWEPVEEEVESPVLERTPLEDNVWIDSVVVEDEDYTSGVAEIHLTPLGLSELTAFYLVNEDGDESTVIWNPVTGGTHVYDGRVGLDDWYDR